jgi:hypothetical protein
LVIFTKESLSKLISEKQEKQGSLRQIIKSVKTVVEVNSTLVHCFNGLLLVQENMRPEERKQANKSKILEISPHKNEKSEEQIQNSPISAYYHFSTNTSHRTP